MTTLTHVIVLQEFLSIENIFTLTGFPYEATYSASKHALQVCGLYGPLRVNYSTFIVQR